MSIHESLKEQTGMTLGGMIDRNQEYASWANKAVFGICRYKDGIRDDKTTDLIHQGVNLCNFLLVGDVVQDVEDWHTLPKNQVEALLVTYFLDRFLIRNETFAISIDGVLENTRKGKGYLDGLQAAGSSNSVEDAEKWLDFFASLGGIFLRMADVGLEEREKGEQIRYI